MQAHPNPTRSRNLTALTRGGMYLARVVPLEPQLCHEKEATHACWPAEESRTAPLRVRGGTSPGS